MAQWYRWAELKGILLLNTVCMVSKDLVLLLVLVLLLLGLVTAFLLFLWIVLQFSSFYLLPVLGDLIVVLFIIIIIVPCASKQFTHTVTYG